MDRSSNNFEVFHTLETNKFVKLQFYKNASSCLQHET